MSTTARSVSAPAIAPVIAGVERTQAAAPVYLLLTNVPSLASFFGEELSIGGD